MTSLSRTVRRLAGAALAAGALLALASPASAQSLIRDTEIESIIHEWSAPVFTAMGLDPEEVEILLVNDNELNAFATRGRIMGLNTGLILRTRNPGELLGVIAHEAGHIKNRHTLRDGAQQAGMQPMLMTMALGALAIAAGAPDAGAVLLGNSQYFGTLSALRYMTHQEGALQAAGESGRGLVSFFENFRSQEVFSDARRFPYFRSHPLSSDRIENLRRYVSEQSNFGKTDSPDRLAQHALVLAKIHAFMDNPQQALRDYPATETTLPGRYAHSIALYRSGRTDAALAAVDALLNEYPDNPYFWELKGQILFEEGRAADAIDAHARAVELKPDAPLLRVNLGHAMIEARDPAKLAEATEQLKRATALERDNTMAWRLLGQAYSAQGKEGEARLASAEMYFAAGAQAEATQFALRAREHLGRGTPEWTRAMDIILSSGATPEDIEDLDRQRRRQAPTVIPAASASSTSSAS